MNRNFSANQQKLLLDSSENHLFAKIAYCQKILYARSTETDEQIPELKFYRFSRKLAQMNAHYSPRE